MHGRDGRRRGERPPSGRSRLWAAAVLWFGVGDVATTAVGFGMGGVVEAGPVAGPLVAEHGLVAGVVLKLVAFAGCYVAWRWLPGRHSRTVPLGLATLGLALTAWNLLVLASVHL